jgi:integrase
MTGAIFSRTLKDGSKRYDAVWRVDGKQKWKMFHRKKDAERFLADAVKATYDGTYQDVTPALITIVLDRWMVESMKTRINQGLLKASTARSYTSMINAHLRPAFGAIRSDKLRERAVDEWASDMAQKIADGDMAPKSYNNIVVLFDSILEWARRAAQGYLVHNPLTNLKLLPKSRMECAFLDPAGIEALLGLVDDIRDGTILTLAIYSGLRRGEIFALQWCDIDWQNRQIFVRHGISANAVSSPKTRASFRRVDVPFSLLACLSIYRANFQPLPGDFVFRTETGAWLDPDNFHDRSLGPILKRLEAVWRPSGDRAGAASIRGLHGLRHTYASLLINLGEHIKFVSEQLGHASIQITADLYGHLFKETRTAAMERLDRGIGVKQLRRSQVVSSDKAPRLGDPSNSHLTDQAESSEKGREGEGRDNEDEEP